MQSITIEIIYLPAVLDVNPMFAVTVKRNGKVSTDEGKTFEVDSHCSAHGAHILAVSYVAELLQELNLLSNNE